MQVRAIGVILLLVVACQDGETPEQSQARIAADRDSARTEITGQMHGFTRWFGAGDLDSLAIMVTDDYQALVPNRTAITGKEPWLEWMGRLIAQGRWTEELTSDLIEVSGPLAVQRGRYALRFEPGPGASESTVGVSDTGKFLWHWRRVEGRWLLAQAAWSSDSPAPR